MAKVFYSLLSVIVTLVIWVVLAGLIHGVFVLLVMLLNWLVNVPFVGAIVRWVWDVKEHPTMWWVALVAGGLSGYFSGRYALICVHRWLPEYCVFVGFWSIAVVAFLYLIGDTVYVALTTAEFGLVKSLDYLATGVASIAGGYVYYVDCKGGWRFPS